MIDDTLLEAEEKMEKAVLVAKDDMATIRTGRAAPAMFNKVMVDYYGTLTPVNQIASLAVPEPRMVIVKPYDAGSMSAIEKAIRDSDLGVNPTDDGSMIRVVFPTLTEERRREMTKVVRHKGEEARVSVRSVRRHAMQQLERMIKDGDAGKDEVRRAEKDLEQATHGYVVQIDEIVRHKEAELLEV